MKSKNAIRGVLLCSAGTMSLFVGAAHAQTSTTPADDQASAATSVPAAAGDDIVVTARRRNETLIAVPVAITAIGGLELRRRGISSIDALARSVPSLIAAEAAGSPQGGIIAIRGISGVDSNPFGDQAVSFNIDGVQVARSSVRRLGQMDLAQIEVLKGPQALFYGKNSPAGIIAIHTADPTPNFQAGLSTAYEFVADETRTEGFVSGPITDTLGVRLAGYFDHMEGYLRNVAPRTGPGIFGVDYPRVPNSREFAVRGTLKWQPSDRFDARLKVSYNKVNGSAPTMASQLVFCPGGVPQNSFAPENCVADGKVTVSDLGPNFSSIDRRFGDGTPVGRYNQTLIGFEANYKLSDDLKLSSITGYYQAHNFADGNFSTNFQDTNAPFPLFLLTGSKSFLAAIGDLRIKEKSQELRLTSSFDGPFNFLLGGFYQGSTLTTDLVVGANAINPFFLANNSYRQEGTAYSTFAQGQIELTQTLELSAGARYSYERKRLPYFGAALITDPARQFPVDIANRQSFDNVSPEVTLSFRPSPRLTVYGGYKTGFLSGGFNAASVPFVMAGALPAVTNGRITAATNLNYDQQTTKGFEGGIKTSLFDNTLRTNLSIFTYRTNGLQVGVLEVVNGTPAQVLRNAGLVRTTGVEFDVNYRTSIRGLSFSGSINYLNGKYLDYQAACYQGLQMPDCRVQSNRFTGSTGLFHDLSGTELVRAPRWTGNAGVDYESPISNEVKIGFSGNINLSDSLITDVISTPTGRQKAYQLFDASVRLSQQDDRWEVSLIGRNLSNRYYFDRSSSNPFSGDAPGLSTTPGLLADQTAIVNRGREVMLRVAFRFGG